jgi:glycerol kinase
MSILVVDVGTSGLRAAVVDPDGTIRNERYQQALPQSPFPGLVEFDGAAMAEAALELARQVRAEAGSVEAVGIANQRASTLVWDRATGTPLAPGLGWQDLRTVGECLVLCAEGFRVAPNLSATKLAALLDQVDPDRTRAAAGELCFGTVDSWMAWTLSGGAVHATDLSNAAVTGLLTEDASAWNDALLERLRIPTALLPTLVDSSGAFAEASALEGSPPICGMAGDQQASLIGQGCVEVGPAKITFGTGGMLDTIVGDRPDFVTRGGCGTFPIVAWRRGDETVWGIEAVMLSAGSNVEWLRDDLGIIATAEESHDVASQVEGTEGVMYVPALLGLGTPVWDYGARGTLVGLTRGADRRHIVRAVLEGVAHRGADLLEAAEGDAGRTIEALRVDGGMSRNPTFVQALADAAQRPVEVSRAVEATTSGAAFLAGLAIGTWGSWSDVASTWQPQARVEPAAPLDRDAWRRAVERSQGWFPELSGIDF